MNNKTGSGDKFLDVAAYALAILLFVKTADVMGYFSPAWLNAVVGFDVSFLYGIVNAFLVEGMALALHFNHRAILSPMTQIVKWILVGISAACQVLDGYIATGNAAGMTDTMKFAFQIGVPLIPIAVFVMLFLIGKLPDDGSKKAPFRGIKNMLPNLDKIWNGEHYVAPAPALQTFASEEEQPELEEDEQSSGGDEPKQAKLRQRK